jgi:hypothetical protein
VLTGTGVGAIPAWEAAASSGATLTGSTNNTITTVTGADAIQGEANLTFDGGTLSVAGSTNDKQTWIADSGTELLLTVDGNAGLFKLDEDDDDADSLYGWAIDGTQIMRLHAGGALFVNDSANANMTIGETINVGANVNEAFTIKQSAVAHGMTDIAETDSAATMTTGASGGLTLRSYSETGMTSTITVQGFSTDVNTGRATNSTGNGIVVLSGSKKSSATVGTVGANANLVSISDNGTNRFIFDSDGDSHQDVGTAWTNYDTEEDAQICRSVAHVMTGLAVSPKVKGAGGLVRSKFDKWGVDHRESLIEMGLIPRLTQKEIDNGDRPLMNMTQLARVHNGAIWQLHVGQEELKEFYEERISQLETQVTRLLEN